VGLLDRMIDLAYNDDMIAIQGGHAEFTAVGENALWQLPGSPLIFLGGFRCLFLTG
jgi:hypothetical protein